MREKNVDLRRLARAEGVPFWRIAEAMNISEPTMTRRLRRELSTDEKVVIVHVIKQLGGDVANGAE